MTHLERRLALLERPQHSPVTLEELLDRIDRKQPCDDPDFQRRLAASAIGRWLADLNKRLGDDPMIPS